MPHFVSSPVGYMDILEKYSKCHSSVCSEKRRGLLFAEDDNYTGCKDDDRALMASWWDQAWRNYFHFLSANVHQAYFEEIYLQEHYSPDMVNDLMLTTISVIFFRQHHISLIKCCRQSNSQVKGTSPPTPNNP